LFSAGVPKSKTFTVTVVENAFCGLPEFPLACYAGQCFDLYPIICPGKTDNFTTKRICRFFSGSNQENWFNDDCHNCCPVRHGKWKWQFYFNDPVGQLPGYGFVKDSYGVDPSILQGHRFNTCVASEPDKAICDALDAGIPTVMPAKDGQYGFTFTNPGFGLFNCFYVKFTDTTSCTWTIKGTDGTGVWTHTEDVVNGVHVFFFNEHYSSNYYTTYFSSPVTIENIKYHRLY
jgi:hypothetical protein